MHLLGASPMGGPVERIEVDLDWLSGWVAEEGRCDLAGEGQGRRSPLATTRRWLRSDEPLLRVAEAVAIRLAGRLGDVAPPVNSLRTSAWADYSPADWAATAVANEFRHDPNIVT